MLRISAGARYMLTSALFFALMSIFVKLAGQRLPTSMLVLTRAAITLGLSWAWLRYRGIPTFGVNRRLLLLRGLFGLGGLACFFYGVTHLPLAEATTIQYASPLFTALLAAAVLREPVSRRLGVATIISLSGLLAVTRPSFLFSTAAPPLDPLPVAVAVIGALLSACAYVVVRKLRHTDDPMVIVFYFPLVATPCVLPFAIHDWIWPTGIEWLYLALIGVCVQLGQVFLTRGLYAATAGNATSISYIQIVLATITGVLIFGERPDMWTLIGAGGVVVGTLIVAPTKSSRGTPDLSSR